jgi:tetratricopeptide (TPR) repeat protein
VNEPRVTPSVAASHLAAGLELLNQRKLSQAARQSVQGLQANPEYAEAHYKLGLLRLQWGDLNAAIGSFREALRTKPRYAPAQLCLANAFTQLARANQRYVDEAILAYRRAVSLDPRQRLSWYSACKKGSTGMSRPTFASTKPRR